MLVAEYVSEDESENNSKDKKSGSYDDEDSVGEDHVTKVLSSVIN